MAADYPFNNSSSQREREQIIRAERRAQTKLGRQEAEYELERQGRFAKPNTISGTQPSVKYPQCWGRDAPPQWHDPVGLEPPLGFSVEDHSAVGEHHEIEASLAKLDDAQKAHSDGAAMGVVDEHPQQIAPSAPDKGDVAPTTPSAQSLPLAAGVAPALASAVEPPAASPPKPNPQRRRLR